MNNGEKCKKEWRESWRKTSQKIGSGIGVKECTVALAGVAYTVGVYD
jgi:hypothetical protein